MRVNSQSDTACFSMNSVSADSELCDTVIAGVCCSGIGDTEKPARINGVETVRKLRHCAAA